jgi:hypothetical protein
VGGSWVYLGVSQLGGDISWAQEEEKRDENKDGKVSERGRNYYDDAVRSKIDIRVRSQ